SGINAENSVGNPTNTLGTPPSIDNSSSGKVCATLNACSEAKIICGSALVLPKLHSLNHYSASNYSGKKEYKVAQNQNTQMQKHASETNSNWSEFSQNTLVNNLGQIDEHFTKEGTKYESQRIVNGDEKFIIQEFNTFEQTTTQKFNTLEQSTTQELNALKQTPTKEFNTFEQAIIHEQNATREFSAFDRPTDQEVNVSKNSITLEIGDHNDQYNHYSVDYSDYNSFYHLYEECLKYFPILRVGMSSPRSPSITHRFSLFTRWFIPFAGSFVKYRFEPY
ncbi:4652_t:CDS:2, partial [Gigaspora margarita]